MVILKWPVCMSKFVCPDTIYPFGDACILGMAAGGSKWTTKVHGERELQQGAVPFLQVSHEEHARPPATNGTKSITDTGSA